MLVWLPVMVVVTVSVAVIVDLGAVAFFSTLPVGGDSPWSPAMNAGVIGKGWFGLSEVTWTVPRYAGVVLLFASAAVTVTDPPVSALAGLGKPVTNSLVVVPGFTRIAVWLPVMLAVTVSVAVMEELAAAVFNVTL